MTGRKTRMDCGETRGSGCAAVCELGLGQIMRTRPQFIKWEANLVIDYLPHLLNQQDVFGFLVTAGEQIGIGDWRPRFGRFSAQPVVTPERQAARRSGAGSGTRAIDASKPASEASNAVTADAKVRRARVTKKPSLAASVARPSVSDSFVEGERIGRFIIVRDVCGQRHAIAAGAVTALAETDDGALLLLAGGRMIHHTSAPAKDHSMAGGNLRLGRAARAGPAKELSTSKRGPC